MRDIIFAIAARHDLTAIWNYTADRWGLDQADTYIRQIDNTIQHAAKFPGMGSEATGLPSQYRKLISGSHRIIYRLSDTNLIVVRILHERQDVPDDISDYW